MPIPTSHVDAVEAVRAWINGLTDLVGAGKPLPNGAHRWREISPGEGAYAWLVYAGGGPDPGDQVFASRAVVSATIFAGTAAAARVAAVAYLNQLEAAQYRPPETVTLETDGSSAIVAAIDSITGPVDLQPATGDMAFLVDATFLLIPNP